MKDGVAMGESVKPLSFIAGDVVCLKGSSQRMTVEAIFGGGWQPVACVWFDPSGGLKRGQFMAETLEFCDECGDG